MKKKKVLKKITEKIPKSKIFSKNLFVLLTALMLALFISSPSQAFANTSAGTDALTEDAQDEDRVCAPYILLLNPDSAVDRFPLKETKVNTSINGIIAETYVTQSYSNEGKKPINARYVFPASTNVTVHGMQMIVGNNIVTAQIKEKEEAKEEFQEAKSEGKSASLLEQQRPNVFTMDVANIMPGDDVRIELHYTEMIEPAEGIYQFVFPTVTGPRYVSPSDSEQAQEESWVETPYLPEGDVPEGKYSITVNLSAGVPIADVSCRTHNIKVDKKEEGTAKITLSNPGDYAGNRDFILEYQLKGEEIGSGLMLNRGQKENYFMLMVQPPKRCELEDIPPREYMFVLDVSGSMQGFPLTTAKGLIQNLVTNLRESDSFNLMLFSDEITLMSPKSLSATEENIKKAIDLINDQEGGGGTELAPALKSAVKLLGSKNQASSVVLITDGYIFDETAIFHIIDDNMDKVSFFPFGIGTSVNRYLIDGIAKSGQGESFIVTDSSDADETAERFRTYIESPVLTDIQISCQGFDVYDVEPQRLPTLFAEKPIVVYGKWRGDPAGTVKITGRTGSQDYAQEISVEDLTPIEDSQALRYLWARKRIERLTDYGLSENNPDIKEQITQLGLDYSILTPYTSFIAVVDTIQNPTGESTDVDQPLPLPLQVSDFAVGGYRLASEPEDLILLLPAALVVLVHMPSLIQMFRKKERKPV